MILHKLLNHATPNTYHNVHGREEELGIERRLKL